MLHVGAVQLHIHTVRAELAAAVRAAAQRNTHPFVATVETRAWYSLSSYYGSQYNSTAVQH